MLASARYHTKILQTLLEALVLLDRLLQYTAAEGGLLGRLTTLRLAVKALGAWTLGSPLTDSLSRAQMSSYSAHLYFIV